MDLTAGDHLFYGDNLDVLRGFPPAFVDLVYLDPPFNSNADYNALFRTPSGKPVPAQEDAFRDTWQWDDAVSGHAVSEVKRNPDHQAAALMLDAMLGFLGKNALTAYLAMMAVRLIELHRVLKPTGSLYLHCDPTASHYLKLLLDGVFGARNFGNEIIWKRKAGRGETNRDAIRFGVSHDVLLMYRRSGNTLFHRQFRASNPQ
jgi:site-specific DNA-methyltransferase (adenine-specific)